MGFAELTHSHGLSSHAGRADGLTHPSTSQGESGAQAILEWSDWRQQLFGCFRQPYQDELEKLEKDSTVKLIGIRSTFLHSLLGSGEERGSLQWPRGIETVAVQSPTPSSEQGDEFVPRHHVVSQLQYEAFDFASDP